MDHERISLATLAHGAAGEMFDEEFRKVLANIEDPNIEAKAARSVTLTLEVKPREDREVAQVKVKVKSKLASIHDQETIFYLGRQDGELIAVENNPQQMSFDRGRGPSRVVPIGKEGTSDD